MKTSTRIIAAIVTTAGLALAGAASGHPGGSGPGMGMVPGMGMGTPCWAAAGATGAGRGIDLVRR